MFRASSLPYGQLHSDSTAALIGKSKSRTGKKCDVRQLRHSILGISVQTSMIFSPRRLTADHIDCLKSLFRQMESNLNIKKTKNKDLETTRVPDSQTGIRGSRLLTNIPSEDEPSKLSCLQLSLALLVEGLSNR
jgi:hypothetical protein